MTPNEEGVRICAHAVPKPDNEAVALHLLSSYLLQIQTQLLRHHHHIAAGKLKMPFEQNTELDIVVSVLWRILTNPRWIGSSYTIALVSDTHITDVLTDAGIVFTAGLLDALQADSPPSITWFESLDVTIPRRAWGVYAVILKHATLRPKVYVGSGTNANQGVRSRLLHYKRKRCICPAKYIRKALELGYTVSHRALLAHCPIPAPTLRPLLTSILIALEAALTCIFSAMQNPNIDYGYHDAYPWPRSSHSFDYDGACSHNPLLEGVSKNVSLPAAQLEAMAAAANSWRRESHKERSRLRTQSGQSAEDKRRRNASEQ